MSFSKSLGEPRDWHINKPITFHGELDFFAVKNESETPLVSGILARLPLGDSRNLLKVGPRDCL